MNLKAAMVPLETLAALTGVQTSKAEHQVEFGKIYPAFDLQPGKSSARRLIRVCAPAVEARANGLPNPELDTEAWLQTIFPANRNPNGAEVGMRLCLSSETVLDLCRRRMIVPLPPKWRRGRGGSPVIRRDSLISFLLSRDLDAWSGPLPTARN